MINSANGYSNLLTIIPHSAPCYNFLKDNNRARKTVWLVPHVIKHKEESDIISWRCNWGSICEADCIYAMSREGKKPFPNGI